MSKAAKVGEWLFVSGGIQESVAKNLSTDEEFQRVIQDLCSPMIS